MDLANSLAGITGSLDRQPRTQPEEALSARHAIPLRVLCALKSSILPLAQRRTSEFFV
jgi:hypothetical protein